jgi:hypothetical protein
METNITSESLNILKEKDKMPMEQIGFFNNGTNFKIISENNSENNILYLEYTDLKTGDIKKIKFLDKYGQTFFDEFFINGKNTEELLNKAEEFFNIIKSAKWTKQISIGGTQRNSGDVGFRPAGHLVLPFYDYAYKISISSWNSVDEVRLTYYTQDNKPDGIDVFKNDAGGSAKETIKVLKSGLILVELNTALVGSSNKESSGSVVITVMLNLE